MKISKYSQLLKKSRHGAWFNTKRGPFLALRGAVYKAAGLPILEEKAQIAAVLDIKQNEFSSYNFEIIDSGVSFEGIDLTDEGDCEEIPAEPQRACVYFDAITLSTMQCDDGELVFFDSSLLGPVLDVINDKTEGEYIRYMLRHTPAGLPYIAVKDGIELIAAILPVKIDYDELLSRLDTFRAQCAGQAEREGYKGV